MKVWIDVQHVLAGQYKSSYSKIEFAIHDIGKVAKFSNFKY